MKQPLELDVRQTALILIDLQQGIVRAHHGDRVVRHAARLVDTFHQRGGLIFFVTVDFTDGQEMLRAVSDRQAFAFKKVEGCSQLNPSLDVHPGDLHILKRQWSAFYGTELDLQLRRRQMKTLVMAGISTNRGVESTAREAFQLGYNQILVEDAMCAESAEEHDASVRYIFPYLGRVRSTDEVLESL
ncbi:MAG: isochorismatase family protein [Sporolactobacillus sp.]